MTKHNRNLTMTIRNRGHFLWGTWHADTFLMLWSFSRILQGGYCWFSFLLLLGLQHVQTYSGGHLCFCLVSKGWTVESFYHRTERFKLLKASGPGGAAPGDPQTGLRIEQMQV